MSYCCLFCVPGESPESLPSLFETWVARSVRGAKSRIGGRKHVCTRKPSKSPWTRATTTSVQSLGLSDSSDSEGFLFFAVSIEKSKIKWKQQLRFSIWEVAKKPLPSLKERPCIYWILSSVFMRLLNAPIESLYSNVSHHFWMHIVASQSLVVQELFGSFKRFKDRLLRMFSENSVHC